MIIKITRCTIGLIRKLSYRLSCIRTTHPGGQTRQKCHFWFSRECKIFIFIKVRLRFAITILFLYYIGQTGASCHQGKVVKVALLRKEFTRAQHRSHTTRVCEYQLFLRSVLCDGISCLDQRSSSRLYSTPSKILRSQFSRNRH